MASWYVTVCKKGTVESDTNFAPWANYVPKPHWLTGLWAAHKLEHDKFIALSAQFRGGHADRVREAQEVQLTERRAAVQEHLREQRALLRVQRPLRPRRQFPEIDGFLSSFDAPQWRRPILAIIGAH